MRYLVNAVMVIGLVLCNPINAFGNGPLDDGRSLFFQEEDTKYVQFLPNGHMHKNKPRYENFDWKVWNSKHFRIFTYGDSEELAQLVQLYLTEAEQTYEEFSREMKMNAFSKKIQIDIYNSDRDFAETNLSPAPEHILGSTELVKRKLVLIAFRDSLLDFKHLIRHELAHRYHLEMLRLSLQDRFTIRLKLPLWFIEGAAENIAVEWDTIGEMIMRDAYLNNYLGSVTNKHWLHNSLVYKQGHFVLKYLTEQYQHKGDVVGAIFRTARENGYDFEKSFEEVIGKSLVEFEKDLTKHIEERYHHLRVQADITEQAPVLDKGGLLLAVQDNFFLSIKIVLGRETLFINWTDGQNVYSEKLAETGYLKNVALRGRGASFGPPSHKATDGQGPPSHKATDGQDPENSVVYVMNRGGRDELRVQHFSFNQKKKKFKLGKREAYLPEGIQDIKDPVVLSENEIAFIGRDKVFSEVFLFNKKTKELKKLTSAKRHYRGLTYSKSLHALVTSVENQQNHSHDLAFGDLKTGQWRLLTKTAENEFSPNFSPDGKKLLYVSDKDLVHNIYLYDLAANQITPITNTKIGLFRPKWFSAKDGSASGGKAEGMLFNSFAKGQPLIGIAQFPTEKTAKKDSPEKAEADPDLEPFLKHIPDLDSLTVMATVVSEDKIKALAVINRKLALKKLKRGQPQVDFYLVDLKEEAVFHFALKGFKKVKNFGQAEFLVGTNLLLKKSSGKKPYIYDWKDKYYHPLKKSSGFLGIRLSLLWFGGKDQFILKISPDRRHIVVVHNGKLRVHDVIAKTSHKVKTGKVVDVIPVSNERFLVLVKSGLLKRGLKIYRVRFDRLSIKDQIPVKINFKQFKQKIVAWHSSPGGNHIFFITQSKVKPEYFWNFNFLNIWSKAKPKYFNIWLLNWENGHLVKVQSDLPTLSIRALKKEIKVPGETLKVETKNPFDIKRVLTINKEGQVTAEDEPTPYRARKSLLSPDPKEPLTPQAFKVKKFPYRITKPPPLPKPVRIGGGGSIGRGSVIAFSLLALDDVNEQVFTTNLYLTNLKQGFANVGYHHLPSGWSFVFDYSRFNLFAQKLEFGASKNIFLDRYLNWDITVKEQYVNVTRSNYSRKWLQTRVGTTFSLDTSISDWHGPRSGSKVFTSLETGVNDSAEYQNLDLNIDARHYLPFTDRSGLAFRFAGGHSFGPNPTTFVWGGNQTMRGIPIFSQSGNSYVLQSSELRVPIFDIIGAQMSGFPEKVFGMLIKYVDVRGGIYNDVGDIWYRNNAQFSQFFGDHKGFDLQYSTGYFLNVPLWFVGSRGFNLRYNKGMYGNKDWNAWLSLDW